MDEEIIDYTEVSACSAGSMDMSTIAHTAEER
jgi:hypothetical protein